MLTCADWLTPTTLPAGRTPKLVVMGGDGVGPEVTAAALDVIRASGAVIEILTPPHGAGTQGGFPPEAKAACESADAVLFGAAEAASIPVLLYLRLVRDAYANIRPAVSLFDDRGVDMVIVRELSEGLYPGREGDLSALATKWPDYKDPLGRPFPADGKFAVRVVTPEATRRIGRHAAKLCAHRAARRGKPGKVTIITKQNVLKQTDTLFRTLCEEEARAAGVATDHIYVDEAARRMASRPEQFDVVVTTNLFGDILSDVASEAVGGMPVAPSAGIGNGFAYFEPVHGSAPDIVGKGLANPFGSIISAAMALEYLGSPDAAARIINAVRATHRAGTTTSDLGGRSTTSEVTAAVIAHLNG
jgi:isocitrate/isopropylmalate dehydrogenase